MDIAIQYIVDIEYCNTIYSLSNILFALVEKTNFPLGPDFVREDINKYIIVRPTKSRTISMHMQGSP
jgi:hypothetical protein